MFFFFHWKDENIPMLRHWDNVKIISHSIIMKGENFVNLCVIKK